MEYFFTVYFSEGMDRDAGVGQKLYMYVQEVKTGVKVLLISEHSLGR